MERSDHEQVDDGDAYEPPELTEYGTIEAWTRGVRQTIQVSIVL